MKQMIRVMSIILKKTQQVPTAIFLVDIIKEYGWNFGTVDIMMRCYFMQNVIEHIPWALLLPVLIICTDTFIMS